MYKTIYCLAAFVSLVVFAQETPLPESPQVKDFRAKLKKDPYDINVLLHLGMWTRDGQQGIQRNIPQALSYFKRGAALGGGAGFHQALYQIYADGNGVDVDSKAAIHWATESAKNGKKVLLQWAAQKILDRAPGWPRDYDLAIELAGMSSSPPSELGRFYRGIGHVYAKGIAGELKPDGKKAMTIYLKALETGDQPGLTCGHIAELYLAGGVGDGPNVLKGLEWYVEAVRHHSDKWGKGIYSERIGDLFIPLGKDHKKEDLIQAWAWKKYALEMGVGGNNNRHIGETKQYEKMFSPQELKTANARLAELLKGNY